MAVPFRQLLQEAPSNYVQFTGYKTATDKTWAKTYHPITELVVHTRVVTDETGGAMTVASWDDAMLPAFADDQLRLDARGSRPNQRRYRFETESDMALWFHSEVSNVVLAAWNDTPVALQTCEAKPRTDEPISEMVDITYSLGDKDRRPLAVGEFKRNLIIPVEWQTGRLKKPQVLLSRELRGYAAKYKCPQLFCFDGETLLLLQFRANEPDDITNKNCKVDCWVLPRNNPEGGCTLRYGLHRLLVQGFRRCQGLAEVKHLSINGYAPKYRELYTGRPVFSHGHGRLSHEHPQSEEGSVFFDREVDINDGSFYWRYNGQPLLDENGGWVRDTKPTWAAQGEQGGAGAAFEVSYTATVAGPSTT